MVELIETSDGSHSLKHTQHGATYHSLHGAYQESLHVFIHSGLAYYYEANKSTSIRIIEYGFGTGLNALLSLDYAVRNGIEIHYVGIEKHPIEALVAQTLNYTDLETLRRYKKEFEHLHSCPMGEIVNIAPQFKLEKLTSDFEMSHEMVARADIIYHDAFGPKIHPTAWELPMTNLSYERLNSDGMLVTYCAQGQFRRNLVTSGFTVERIPGPPGKREMIRALKTK